MTFDEGKKTNSNFKLKKKKIPPWVRFELMPSGPLQYYHPVI